MLYSTFCKRPLYEQIEILQGFNLPQDESGEAIESLLNAAQCCSSANYWEEAQYLIEIAFKIIKDSMDFFEPSSWEEYNSQNDTIYEIFRNHKKMDKEEYDATFKEDVDSDDN